MVESFIDLPEVKVFSTDNWLEAAAHQHTVTCQQNKEKTLIVTSKGFSTNGTAQKLARALGANSCLMVDDVKPNPDVAQLSLILTRLKPHSISSIVALGGGSVLDTAKLLKFALSRGVWNWEAVLGEGQKEPRRHIDLVTIPTTSGTGAEVTPFATVWESAENKKHSISPCQPDCAILDPTLTLSLNRQQTLYPALDSLSHGLESLWNVNRTETSTQYAEKAVRFVVKWLPTVLEMPDHLEGRKMLQIAACYAGLAISVTKTALAHAISYPLTLTYGVPHGLACSFTLSSIIRHYGAGPLKLDKVLADNVLEVLDSLSLNRELEQYLDSNSLDMRPFINLEPSRAGNFVAVLAESDVQIIIEQSVK